MWLLECGIIGLIGLLLVAVVARAKSKTRLSRCLSELLALTTLITLTMVTLRLFWYVTREKWEHDYAPEIAQTASLQNKSESAVYQTFGPPTGIDCRSRREKRPSTMTYPLPNYNSPPDFSFDTVLVYIRREHVIYFYLDRNGSVIRTFIGRT